MRKKIKNYSALFYEIRHFNDRIHTYIMRKLTKSTIMKDDSLFQKVNVFKHAIGAHIILQKECLSILINGTMFSE